MLVDLEAEIEQNKFNPSKFYVFGKIFRKEGKKLKNENFFGRLEGMMVNEDDCSKVKALNCHFDHISVES